MQTAAAAVLAAKSSLVTVPRAPRTRGGRHGSCAPRPSVLSHPDAFQPRRLEGCGRGWDILSSRRLEPRAGLANPGTGGGGGGGQLWAHPGLQALAKSGQGGKKLGELINFICKDDYFFFCPQPNFY